MTLVSIVSVLYPGAGQLVAGCRNVKADYAKLLSRTNYPNVNELHLDVGVDFSRALGNKRFETTASFVWITNKPVDLLSQIASAVDFKLGDDTNPDTLSH